MPHGTGESGQHGVEQHQWRANRTWWRVRSLLTGRVWSWRLLSRLKPDAGCNTSGQSKQCVRSRGQQHESVVTRRRGAFDRFWSARLVTLVRKRVLLSDSYDRMNKIQSKTCGVHRGGHGGVTGCCARPVKPDQRVRSSWVRLFHEPTALFFRGLL
jgi:hypothetical protein